MNWVKRVSPPHNNCLRPANELVGVGSVWRCPVCGRHWKVTGISTIGEPIGWQPLSDQFEDGDQTR